MSGVKRFFSGLGFRDGRQGTHNGTPSNSQDVSRNADEAVKWWHFAAEHGLAEAQYYLGVCYYEGEGVPQDCKESIKWYRMAANQGHVLARSFLELLVFQGISRADSGEEALKLRRLEEKLTKADTKYMQGNVSAYACYNVAATYGDKKAAAKHEAIMKTMTPAQIAEGQELSRVYAEKFIKK